MSPLKNSFRRLKKQILIMRNKKRIVWPADVYEKLFSLRSKHFTTEETQDYLIMLVLEIEDILSNPLISSTYTEESGKYSGVSRVVINKFKIYYEIIGSDIVIISIVFPGENPQT
jgi:plasmid stabilization system protein ParE